MEDFNLRHILFIPSPAVFWRLVAPAIQLVVKCGYLSPSTH